MILWQWRNDKWSCDNKETTSDLVTIKKRLFLNCFDQHTICLRLDNIKTTIWQFDFRWTSLWQGIFLRYVELLIINHALKFCKVIIVINSFALIAVITLIYIYYHFANCKYNKKWSNTKNNLWHFCALNVNSNYGIITHGTCKFQGVYY